MSNIDENINYLENMSKTHDELIDKAFELRKKDSFEESLLAARSALAMDSESADAWWLIALNN